MLVHLKEWFEAVDNDLQNQLFIRLNTLTPQLSLFLQELIAVAGISLDPGHVPPLPTSAHASERKRLFP